MEHARRSGSNASSPFITSTQRDKARVKKKPFYYHASAWVKQGGLLRFRGKARHEQVYIGQVGPVRVYSTGANYPRRDPNVFYKCSVS